ncbi:MAG: hypothetical protein V3V03_04195 [Hyphomonadaceae bacterium]
MNKRSATLFVLALSSVSACASHDRQDQFLLGDATRANIALQSVRDPNQPNTAKVEGQSGERAVLAVQRLNNGETTPLDSVNTTNSSGG